MRKGWIVLLTAVLVVAFAAPAMADLKVTGFYRAKAMLSNFFDGGGNPSVRTEQNEQTNAYVEQRARIKFDVGGDAARAVLHFESDMNWGAASASAARNEGGALSADSVQLETKEVYVWFKVPDTSIQAKVGMQSVNDHYAGIFSNGADMAGIFVNGTFEPVKWTLGWAKLWENEYNQNDDADMYLASVQFAPAKDMTLGFNFYWVKDDTARDATSANAKLNPFDETSDVYSLYGYKANVYMPGVNFAMNAGPAKISAFAFYQWGELEASTPPAATDIDINAFMIDLRADLKLGPGNFFVEGFYISGGDDPTDEYESIITLGDYQTPSSDTPRLANGTGGNSGFGRTNMYFLFGADSLNVSQCLIGCSGGQWGDTFGNGGRGVWHVAAGYSQKFTEKIKGAVNAGYLAATKLYVGESAAGRDKDMGTEFNARLDYTISKGLDLSLVGAYLMMGDFDNTNNKVEDYWMGYGRIAYSF